MNHLIYKSIKAKTLLEFQYEGKYYVVEPHVYGLTSEKHEIVVGYKLKSSNSREGITNWHSFEVIKMTNLKITNETVKNSRDDINQSLHKVVRVYCRL